MLLRESGEREGKKVEAGELGGSGDTGVPHAALLTRFVDAIFDPAAQPGLAAAREALKAAAGFEAVVDAAAVAANFQRMNRFTDATGVPLDATTEMVSRELRAQLGADGFDNAANTPTAGFFQRALGPIFKPFTRLGMWWMTRRAR